MKQNSLKVIAVLLALGMAACDDDDDAEMMQSSTITIENVLDSKPLVQSGTFQGTGTPPVILPGESVSFSFWAAKIKASPSRPCMDGAMIFSSHRRIRVSAYTMTMVCLSQAMYHPK